MEKHGQSTFRWKGDLFILEAQGPFNEEGQLHACQQIKASIKDSDLTHWRRLEI